MANPTALQTQLANKIAAKDVQGVNAFVTANKQALAASPTAAMPIYVVLDEADNPDAEANMDKLIAITKILLKAGLKEKPNSDSNPLLSIASDVPNPNTLRIAEVLLEDDPDQLFDQYSVNRTILNMAVLSGNIDLIKLILDFSPAVVNFTATNGQIPLHVAAHANNPDIVKLLLSKGAMVNGRAKSGNTPLFYSVEATSDAAKRYDIIKQLIDAGADKTLKNEDNVTAYDIALQMGNPANELELLKPEGAAAAAFVPLPAVVPARPLITPDLVGDEYIPNSMDLKGFEVRTLVLGTEVLPVYTATLKRGTLLFRGIRNIRQLRNDVLGMNVKQVEYDADGDEIGEMENPDLYCLASHYNVYFYPFPFIDVTVGAFTNVAIYILKDDVKVATYISPTPMARADRAIKGMPITSCDQIDPFDQGCSDAGMEGRKYDPCFNHKFISENPDVVGMIAMAGLDRRTFATQAATAGTTLNKHYNKYFSTYTDSHNLVPGIPEIILHPRNPRITREFDNSGIPSIELVEETSTFTADTALGEWFKVKKNADSVPYLLYHIFQGRNDKDIEDYMTQLTSTDGLDGQHAQIDKITGFYVLREFATPATFANLLPSDQVSKMAESFPELIFTRAKVLPGFVPPSGGRHRRTLRSKRKRS